MLISVELYGLEHLAAFHAADVPDEVLGQVAELTTTLAGVPARGLRLAELAAAEAARREEVRPLERAEAQALLLVWGCSHVRGMLSLGPRVEITEGGP
jgi:hypothetical protein